MVMYVLVAGSSGSVVVGSDCTYKKEKKSIQPKCVMSDSRSTCVCVYMCDIVLVRYIYTLLLDTSTSSSM